MKIITLILRIALLVAVIIAAPAALAITAGQIDDFEDGSVMGWQKGFNTSDPPSNVQSGGPQGANDNYLQNLSTGGSGADSKMVIFNLAQWTGNYNAAEIQSIRMWLVNEGNSAMQIRVAINGGNNTWFASTTGFALPADDTWRQATFDLNSNAVTRVQGTDSLATVLNSVGEMRILSKNNPDFRGASMFATLGVDDIEAVAIAPPPPKEFLDLVSLANFNGNNKTDLGVLLRDSDTGKNKLYVMDGGSGNNIKTVSFGSGPVRDSTTVPDATGDLIPEFAALREGSLFAQVKDVVNNTLLGKPRFNPNFDTVAFLSVGGDLLPDGNVSQDVAVVGRDPVTGKVQAWVKEVVSGNLVSRFSFSKAFMPFAAVAVDNVGDSVAMEIAVLGIDASGNVQAQVKDALSGKLISKIQFNKQFTPLFFAAVPNASGKLKHLAVLGRNASGVIQAQIKRVSNGTLVSKVQFSKSYDPRAFISFADSNGSGGGEIGVVGVNATGTVRAQVKEIADGTKVATINFSKAYPPLDAIAVNSVAGTGQNEIAVLGENASDQLRLQIKDLLTGNLVKNIPVP